MQITIHYFALMREQTGLREETVETDAQTPADLLRELSQRHAFTLQQDRLRVVINEEFAPWSQPLNANDTVAFIPPVAGG